MSIFGSWHSINHVKPPYVVGQKLPFTQIHVTCACAQCNVFTNNRRHTLYPKNGVSIQEFYLMAQNLTPFFNSYIEFKKCIDS